MGSWIELKNCRTLVFQPDAGGPISIYVQRDRNMFLFYTTPPDESLFSCVYNDRVVAERSKMGHRDRLSDVGKEIDKRCKFQSKQKTIDYFILTS